MTPQIYMIRHGEKPDGEPTPTNPGIGVDVNGNQDEHALLPRGWQRCGALTVLFGPALGSPRVGVHTPTALYAPDYGSPDETQTHRPYQTIEGLSDLLGLPIKTPFGENQEAALADAVLAETANVVLICWEHHRIPAIGAALPTVPDTDLPTWPDDRFDMIWSFTPQLALSPAEYVFTQIPQHLLAGDTDTVF